MCSPAFAQSTRSFHAPHVAPLACHPITPGSETPSLIHPGTNAPLTKASPRPVNTVQTLLSGTVGALATSPHTWALRVNPHLGHWVQVPQPDWLSLKTPASSFWGHTVALDKYQSRQVPLRAGCLPPSNLHRGHHMVANALDSYTAQPGISGYAFASTPQHPVRPSPAPPTWPTNQSSLPALE